MSCDNIYLINRHYQDFQHIEQYKKEYGYIYLQYPLDNLVEIVSWEICLRCFQREEKKHRRIGGIHVLIVLTAEIGETRRSKRRTERKNI